MESPHGKKRPLEKDEDVDSDSDKSVQSYIYLGDVDNTVNEYSSSESSVSKLKSPKKKKFKLSCDGAENAVKSVSDDNSDCQVTGYETPPKENNSDSSNIVDCLYPNQLEHPDVAGQYFLDMAYDADDDDDDNNDENNATQI